MEKRSTLFDLGLAGGLAFALLVVIALIRKRFLHVSLAQSLVQVTLGGAIVAGVGFALGQA